MPGSQLQGETWKRFGQGSVREVEEGEKRLFLNEPRRRGTIKKT